MSDELREAAVAELVAAARNLLYVGAVRPFRDAAEDRLGKALDDLAALAARPVSPPLDVALDRALAVPHRDDDQPCSCDECMAYGAEDSGADWYRIPPANRVAIRILDGADDRLAAIAKAFRDHDEDVSPTLDVERRLREMRYHPTLSGRSGDFRSGWDAATVALLDALAADAPERPA